jgi:glucan phosphoethanolaminetransferase (alkaline phosphatase superfamily)
MPNPAWLDEVRDELARQRLPQRYMQRYLEELADHLDDAAAAGQAPAAAAHALGRPQDLAHAARQVHCEAFAARHPWLVFVILPLPLALVSLVAGLLLVLLGYGCLASMLGLDETWRALGTTTATPPFAAAYFLTTLTMIGFVPPMLLAWWWCRVAWTIGCRSVWPMCSCLLLALLAGSYQFSFPEAPNAVRAGLHLQSTFLPMQLLQFLGPCLILTWFLTWRHRKEHASLRALGEI